MLGLPWNTGKNAFAYWGFFYVKLSSFTVLEGNEQIIFQLNQ